MKEFVDMLNEMRFGRLSQKSIQKFRSLSREVVYDDGLGPTELLVFLSQQNLHRLKLILAGFLGARMLIDQTNTGYSGYLPTKSSFLPWMLAI